MSVKVCVSFLLHTLVAIMVLKQFRVNFVMLCHVEIEEVASTGLYLRFMM